MSNAAAGISSTGVGRSEDILSARTDLCISNAIVKAGLGFGGGVVASAILFRRRPWPVLMGLGFGLGGGYSDCERIFNPASIPGFVIVPSSSSTTPPPPTAVSPFAFLDSTISAVKKEASQVMGKESKAVDEKVAAAPVGKVAEKVEVVKDNKRAV